MSFFCAASSDWSLKTPFRVALYHYKTRLLFLTRVTTASFSVGDIERMNELLILKISISYVHSHITCLYMQIQFIYTYNSYTVSDPKKYS